MTNIFESSSKSSNIIKNEELLGYDYVPKSLPFREGQVQEISNSIKSMLEGRKGTNLFIHGAPGIGKTASMRWVLRELQEYTDDVVPLYVNCWRNRTKYFIFTEIANQLKLAFTTGKSAEHVLQQIEYRLKGKNAVFVFDEIDKAENAEFLYQIVELFPRSTIMLASNTQEYTVQMDPRIKSRLMLRALEFKPYSIIEIGKILGERVKLSLKSESLDPSILKQIANITHGKGDLRVGLFIIRESARNAEDENRKSVSEKDVMEVIAEMEHMDSLESPITGKEEEFTVRAIKENNGKISGEIYEAYKTLGGTLSYRSFKRTIERLVKDKTVRTEDTGAGFQGKSKKIFLN